MVKNLKEHRKHSSAKKKVYIPPKEIVEKLEVYTY